MEPDAVVCGTQVVTVLEVGPVDSDVLEIVLRIRIAGAVDAADGDSAVPFEISVELVEVRVDVS